MNKDRADGTGSSPSFNLLQVLMCTPVGQAFLSGFYGSAWEVPANRMISRGFAATMA